MPTDSFDPAGAGPTPSPEDSPNAPARPGAGCAPSASDCSARGGRLKRTRTPNTPSSATPSQSQFLLALGESAWRTDKRGNSVGNGPGGRSIRSGESWVRSRACQVASLHSPPLPPTLTPSPTVRPPCDCESPAAREARRGDGPVRRLHAAPARSCAGAVQNDLHERSQARRVRSTRSRGFPR